MSLFQGLLFPVTSVDKRKLERRISGRTVVITGASYGIGEALALLLSGTGAHLVLIARTEEKLLVLKEKIELHGSRVSIIPADLSKSEDVARVVQALGMLPNGIDIFISNAGRSIHRSIFDSLDRLHDYSRLMALNYFAPIQLLLGVIPIMINNGGHILNVSTASVLLPPAPGWAAYLSSKAAFDSWFRSVAAELHIKGVHTSSLYFPLVRTRMIEPTKAYRHLPALSVDHAARWIAKAMMSRRKRVAPWWLGLARLGIWLAGSALERIAMRYLR